MWLCWSDVVVAGKASEGKLKTKGEGAKLTFVLDELFPLDCFFTCFSVPFVDGAGTYVHLFPFDEAALRSDSFFRRDDFFFPCVSAAGMYSYIPSRSFFVVVFLTSTACSVGGFSTTYLVFFFFLWACIERAGRK